MPSSELSRNSQISSVYRLKHAEQELKKKEAEFEKIDQDYKKNMNTHNALTQNLAQMEVCVLICT